MANIPATRQIQAKLSVLTAEQTASVHQWACQILETTRVRVDAPQAIKRFQKAGCRVDSGNRVRIAAELIDWAVETAPAAVHFYKRGGEAAFEISGKQRQPARFGIGVTNLYYQDPLTDHIERFTRRHTVCATALGHRLSGFDVISTPGIVSDAPENQADLYTALDMAAHTDKPLIILVSEQRNVGPVFDLLAHVGRDLAPQPWAAAYVNPITPLVINAETVEKMEIAISRGIPVIYSNYGMSGATAPITAAGSLTLLTAELLAGLVLSQLIKPGAPIILGSLPAGFDMKTMASVYTPTTMLLNVACAEMMAHYRLPHCGTSGSGPGWGPDLLAAGGFWMNHFSASMSHVGLAPFVGGNHDSLVFSPAAVVYADEIIRQSREFARGFDLSADTVALADIEQIGPGGNFLTAPQTLKHFRHIQTAGPIWPNMPLDQWRKADMPRADARLRQFTMKLLDEPVHPVDCDDLIETGQVFIDRLTR